MYNSGRHYVMDVGLFFYLSILVVLYSILEIEGTPVYAFHLDMILKKKRTIKKISCLMGCLSYIFLFIFSSSSRALGFCIYVVIL